MPCNSVITVTVEMGANVDSGLLVAGLKRIGAAPARQSDGSISFTVDGARGSYAKGKLSLALGYGWATKDTIVNKVKASYAYESVMSAVRKMGGSSTVDARQDNVIHVRLADRSN